MARGLQVGLVLDERKAEFERGDFLVRTVLGADHERRAVAVGAEVEVGTTVQFQVRDGDVGRRGPPRTCWPTAGDAALVFTCTGRGTRLFGEPDHDAGVVNDHVRRRPPPACSAPARSARWAASTSSTR